MKWSIQEAQYPTNKSEREKQNRGWDDYRREKTIRDIVQDNFQTWSFQIQRAYQKPSTNNEKRFSKRHMIINLQKPDK